MTSQEFETLLNSRSEGEHLEFKEARNSYEFDELLKYCVAIANEGGGHMILGVTDKLPRAVVGTSAFEKPEETIGAIYERLSIRVAYQELFFSDRRALIFVIPSRLQGHPLHYQGRYWMRAGDKLVPMSPDQLRRIFDEDRPEFVNRIAKANCSEETVMRLLDIQSYFDLRNRSFPSTRREALNTFVQKGFLRCEGGGENFDITNLGALLFAKNLSDFDDLAYKVIRVIVYDGTTKNRIKDGKDINFLKGYAAGFDSLIDYIYDQLPATEEISNALRSTTYAYPKKVIRELVGNAIVHQDLEERGTRVTIEIYSNRVEVTNPGLPLLKVDRFIDENQSRNERLASRLRQLGICEERGHGMDEIVARLENSHMPPYTCRLGSRHTTMILSSYKPWKSLTSEERIGAVYQHCCLRCVNDEITTNESIRHRFNIEKQNAAKASRLLRDAVEAGVIRSIGSEAVHRLRRYVPYWA